MNRSVAKKTSIICLVMVIFMHIPSWMVFDGDSAATDKILQVVEYYTKDIFEEGDPEWAQQQLDAVDSGFDIDDIISDMGKLLNPVKDLGISPVDFLSITAGYIGVTDFMTSQALIDVVGDNLTENDPETALGLNIIRVILVIEVVLLIATVVVAIIQMICHLKNRKGLGISVPIIVFINLLYMAVICAFVDALFSDLAGLKVRFTIWAWVALVYGILACFFWAKERKELRESVE